MKKIIWLSRRSMIWLLGRKMKVIFAIELKKNALTGVHGTLVYPKEFYEV